MVSSTSDLKLAIAFTDSGPKIRFPADI